MCTTRSDSHADYLIYVLCFFIFLKYLLCIILEILFWENRFIVKPSQSWKQWNRISTNVVGFSFKGLHITTHAFIRGARCAFLQAWASIYQSLYVFQASWRTQMIRTGFSGLLRHSLPSRWSGPYFGWFEFMLLYHQGQLPHRKTGWLTGCSTTCLTLPDKSAKANSLRTLLFLYKRKPPLSSSEPFSLILRED